MYNTKKYPWCVLKNVLFFEILHKIIQPDYVNFKKKIEQV